MEERIPLTGRQTSYPPSERRERDERFVDDGSLELLEHLIAIVLQGNFLYLETLLRNEEILEVLDLHDNKGFTALHIASERVDPECVRLLLEADANPNVMDRFKRTALHWAVSGGCHCNFCDTKRGRCVGLLLRAKGNLEIKDAKGETPLSYAAKNMFHKAAGVMLDHGAETNEICNGIKISELIIQKIPGLMTHLLDQSIAYDDDDNSKLKINFSVLLQCPLSNKKEEEEIKRTSIEGTPNRKRIEVKAEMGLINSFLNTTPPISDAMLTHPVTLAFVHLKWLYVRKWIWFIRCLYCALTLVFTYFVFGLYFNQCVYDEDNHKKIQKKTTDAESATILPEITSCNPALEYLVLGYCMASWVLYIIITAFYTAFHSCKIYFLTWSNLGCWILICCITITILPCFGILQEFALWQYIMAGFGVFYAWMINISHLGDIPVFGFYIKILTKVLRRILLIGVVYSSILIAFVFGFCVLFPNAPFFKPLPTALTRVFLMMLGGDAYPAIFNPGPGVEPRFESAEYWTATHIYYLGFVILFGIAILNILIGIAVIDIQEFQRNAELGYIESQIYAISHLESMVSDNCIGNFIQKYILCRISVQYRNGQYFRLSPIDPKERILPNEIKIKFIPFFHNRDCLNKREMAQRPLRPVTHSINQNFGFHRNDPARGSNLSHNGQRNLSGTSPDNINIDEILNELKMKLEGVQRRRIVSSPIFC